MGYNKENHLKKIIEIQNIVLREKKRGATQIWIYNNHIKDKYFISQSTFNNYLARPAKRELELLLEEMKKNKNKKSEII